MKNLWKSGILILLVVGVLYIIYLRECKGPDPGPPEGYILVDKADWDSIIAVANEPPDSFITITVVPGPTVYLPNKPIPVPQPVSGDTVAYSDSIVNDSINVWVDVMVEGLILSWDWKYNPITRHIETIIERKVPVPVEVKTAIYKRELFISGVVGGNMDAFSFGGDLDYINLKRNIYGLQYRRLGDEDFYYFKLGVSLKNLFR